MHFMKNCLCVFCCFLLLAACSEVSGNLSPLSVVSGKKVKSISTESAGYEYYYNKSGRITSIITRYGTSTREYAFSYPKEGILEVSMDLYKNTYYYGAVGELISVAYQFSTSDPCFLIFSYSGGMLSRSYGQINTLVECSYEWDENNLSLMTINYEENDNIYDFVYTDIINNFNVPLPFYLFLIGNNQDHVVYPLTLSRNLVEIMNHSGQDSRIFDYERNEAGDIERIIINKNEVWNVEYYE